ncbi:hypothetical protein BST61_g2013 [Cercospora zeina]
MIWRGLIGIIRNQTLWLSWKVRGRQALIGEEEDVRLLPLSLQNVPISEGSEGFISYHHYRTVQYSDDITVAGQGIYGVQSGRILSDGKPSSSNAGDADIGAANDGIPNDPANVFVPSGVPFWYQIDLQDSHAISQVDLTTKLVQGSETFYKYNVTGSADGQTFELLVHQSNAVDVGFSASFPTTTQQYRYIRINVEGVINNVNGQAASWAVGIHEVTLLLFTTADSCTSRVNTMSSDRDSTTVKADSANLTAARDQRLVIDGLSLRKLDNLVDVVTNRLGGGGFGSWWVQGHKASNDNRHLALEEVFALKRAVEDLNTTLSQQGRAPELLDREIKANLKGGRHHELKDEGDDAIETTRVKDRLAALEKEDKDLLDMVKALGHKTKKSGEPTAASNGQRIKAIEKTIADFKRETADTQGGFEKKVISIEESEAVTLNSLSACFELAQRLDEELRILRADFKNTKQDGTSRVRRIEQLEIRLSTFSDSARSDDHQDESPYDDEDHVG